MTEVIDPTGTAEPTLRKPAVVAGVGILLISVLAGLANFGAVEGLVTGGDATKTALDILAAEGLFRLAISAFVLVAVLDAVVAWGLYAFFKPVSRDMSLLAGWLRLAYAAVFAVAISQLAGALHLLSNADYLRTFTPDQLRTQALLKITEFHDIWTVSLVLFGTHLLLVGYLIYRSGFAPKLLGVLVAVAGAGYLVDSFGALLFSDYTVSIGAFTFVGEFLLMLWLLIKGRTIPPATGSTVAGAAAVPGLCVMDPAAHVIERGQGEPDHVERVQHPHRVRQLGGQGGGVAEAPLSSSDRCSAVGRAGSGFAL